MAIRFHGRNSTFIIRVGRATTVVANNFRFATTVVATDLRQNAVASCRKGLVAGLILGSEQGSTGSMTDSKVDHHILGSGFRTTEPFVLCNLVVN